MGPSPTEVLEARCAMSRRPTLLMVLALLLFLPAALALAQTTISPAPDQIYRLTPRSSFEEGCFDPCLCAVHFTDALIGTWRMTPGAPDPRFSVYDVTDVNWFLPGLDLRVTGKGTYRIGGGVDLQRPLPACLVGRA